MDGLLNECTRVTLFGISMIKTSSSGLMDVKVLVSEENYQTILYFLPNGTGGKNFNHMQNI